MQIRKVYSRVDPGLLHDDLKDFVTKHGLHVQEDRRQTYPVPSDSSAFTFRGTIMFAARVNSHEAGREHIRSHVQGAAKGETRLTLDVNSELVPQEMLQAIVDDLDFFFGTYESKTIS